MKIEKLLTAERIISEINPGSAKQVLEQLLLPLKKFFAAELREQLLSKLLERERLSSTGVGQGVAMPHVKLSGIESQLVVFARSSKGINFSAIDGLPVNFFVLLVAPPEEASFHLQLLAEFAHLLKGKKVREQLLKAENSLAIYRLLCQAPGEI